MQTIDHVFTFFVMILFAVSAIFIIKVSGYPLSFYGLTLQKWFRHSIEGLLYSIPILFLGLVLKWVLIREVEIFKDIPFFSISQLQVNYKSIIIFGGFYTLTAPFQELVARGFLQSCLHNFFRGPNRIFLAILTSNLLFQMLHTAIGFWLAIVSFVLGIFWGILFEKQKSLVGVSVSHAFIGTTMFFIFDFNTLFQLAG
jgi:membrane protease YdiL (CAAX protease family)